MRIPYVDRNEFKHKAISLQSTQWNCNGFTALDRRGWMCLLVFQSIDFFITNMHNSNIWYRKNHHQMNWIANSSYLEMNYVLNNRNNKMGSFVFGMLCRHVDQKKCQLSQSCGSRNARWKKIGSSFNLNCVETKMKRIDNFANKKNWTW